MFISKNRISEKLINSIAREETFIRLIHSFHVNFFSGMNSSSSDSLGSQAISTHFGADDYLTGITTGRDVTKQVTEFLHEKYSFLSFTSFISIEEIVNRIIYSLQDHHRNRIFIYNLCLSVFNHIKIPGSLPNTPSSVN
jgi:hypothetical protein